MGILGFLFIYLLVGFVIAPTMQVMILSQEDLAEMAHGVDMCNQLKTGTPAQRRAYGKLTAIGCVSAVLWPITTNPWVGKKLSRWQEAIANKALNNNL